MLEKKTISQFPNTVPNAQRASTRASHFVDDRWIANELSMKASTIRVQRHRLIHGEPHWFAVTPVYIGTSPRYLRDDVERWLSSLPRAS